MVLFSKTDSCSLLSDPQGPAAKRYRHYDAFLDHNHRALRILAELEFMDRGDGLATLSSINRRTRDLLEEVQGLLTSLRALAHNRYEDLPQVFEEVAQNLAPLIEGRRPAIEGPLALPFSHLRTEHLPLAGAKAVNLARIRSELDLPVPDGFVVTTAAFDLFLRENRLLEPIHTFLGEFDPDRAESEDACRRIQKKIQDAPLPKALAERLESEVHDLAVRHGSTPLLALRSSAVGEDTDASFAGQYSTVLSVTKDNVASAYKRVLASKYSPRAILYRLRYGLTDAATPMAVAGVVMIQAKASGVLYSVDPSHPASGQARIDAALGFGDQVVSGSASPDVFWIDRESLQVIESLVQPKEGASGEKQSRPAASQHTLSKLIEFGLKMETHFGGPQDIEWAEGEQGGLVILQSRPLGMTGGDQEAHLFDGSGLKLLLSGGQKAAPGRVSGKAVHARTGLKPDPAEEAILVARTASPDLAPLMGRVRGLITDLGGAASHLASVAREFNVPALMNTRNATSLIAEGEEITLLADDEKVYQGRVPELERKLPGRDEDDEKGPIGRHLRELLDLISPLNLTDPTAPEFAPRGCHTLHDLIRFAHEKAMEEMFNLSQLAEASVVSRKMSANLPLSIHFIDLGGGLTPDLTSCDEILPEHIRSKPMAALWRGLAHPGVTWSGAVDLSGRNFMALMVGSIGPENRVPPKVDSYALVSEDYLNLSIKFGYHYSNLDALCSEDPGVNTITLQFAGGAGTGAGKALRIEFLSQVLIRLGYEVEAAGALLQAALKGLECPAMEEVLDQTGRLLGCSRLLDLAIPSQTEMHVLTEMFFKEEYDFLARSEKRLPGFYASVGEWSPTRIEGEEVIMQDGSNMTGTVSCTLHSALETTLGGRYRRFLENRHALHYNPVAVKRGSRSGDGLIKVEVRIGAGCVDLAAGLAFGLINVGNGWVLALDASAGEVQLLEFINNKRYFRERNSVDLPKDQWVKIEARVAGKEITGALDGRPCLKFTASRSISGYVGLWSKGDTTAYFRNLQTDDAPMKAVAT